MPLLLWGALAASWALTAALCTDDVVAAAIPGFALCMAAEIAAQHATPAPERGAAYENVDAAHSVATGLLQMAVARAAGTALLYDAAWRALSEPAPLGDGVLAHVAGFVLVDLLYYWMHRWSHEYQFLWRGHYVHHSSDRFNLSAALRQSWWQALYGAGFGLLLVPLLPPTTFRRLWGVDTLYQFWVHTCHVDRLPAPLEWLLSTPSHHRVHHHRYVHKNFGGVLIVWDRLFGTFLAEPAARPACLFGLPGGAPPLADAVLQNHVRWGWCGPGYRTATATRTIVAPNVDARLGQ